MRVDRIRSYPVVAGTPLKLDLNNIITVTIRAVNGNVLLIQSNHKDSVENTNSDVWALPTIFGQIYENLELKIDVDVSDTILIVPIKP